MANHFTTLQAIENEGFMDDMLDADDWRKTPEVNGAEIWFRSYFNANTRTDSEAIYEFAIKRWGICLAAKEAIDSKADAVLKFFTVLAASMVTIAKIAGISHDAMAYLVPSIGCFCASCVFALVAMKPVEWPSPLNVKVAFEECDNDPMRQKTQLAASLHCAIVGSNIVLKRKSKCLEYANALAVLGIAALGFVLLS